MGDVTAIGSGPVAFLSAEGRQLSLSLDRIYFDASGAVRARGNAETDHPHLRPWLQHLVRGGQLSPGTAPTPLPALLVESADHGTSGNHITVTVEPTADDSRVDVTASITDICEGLTLADLEHELGRASQAGRRPGLLRVKSQTDPLPEPTNRNTIAPTEAVPPNAPPSYRPTWEVAAAPNGWVRLEARRTQTDPDHITVSVSNVDGEPGAKTLTLTVVWTRTVADVAAADLPGALTDLGFALRFAAPPDGYRLPRPGTVRLGGGRNSDIARASLLADP